MSQIQEYFHLCLSQEDRNIQSEPIQYGLFIHTQKNTVLPGTTEAFCRGQRP
jgi:hypothetical protein